MTTFNPLTLSELAEILNRDINYVAKVLRTANVNCPFENLDFNCLKKLRSYLQSSNHYRRKALALKLDVILRDIS